MLVHCALTVLAFRCSRYSGCLECIMQISFKLLEYIVDGHSFTIRIT